MLVSVREITPNDVNQRYCEWMNDPEVNAYLECRDTRWTEESLLDYIERMKSDHKFFAILADGKHIGNMKIGPINKKHLYADLGLVIGDKSYWGKGCATKAFILMIEQARAMGLHKLICSPYKNSNPGSLKALMKSGFTIAGEYKSHMLLRGEYVDVYLMEKML